MNPEPLTAEQAQHIAAYWQTAIEAGQRLAPQFQGSAYKGAWAVLSGFLASTCSPHVERDAFPAFIPPPPEQETTQ